MRLGGGAKGRTIKLSISVFLYNLIKCEIKFFASCKECEKVCFNITVTGRVRKLGGETYMSFVVGLLILHIFHFKSRATSL